MVIRQNAASTAEVLVVVDETELVTETGTYCDACETFLNIAIECFLLEHVFLIKMEFGVSHTHKGTLSIVFILEMCFM